MALELDKVQKEIVDSNESKILVIAGSGSGKTRVLTERIKRLINDGVPSENIVAITFTNFAADEMKERLGSIIGEAFNTSPWDMDIYWGNINDETAKNMSNKRICTFSTRKRSPSWKILSVTAVPERSPIPVPYWSVI